MWNTPKYLGTVEFLNDHKLRFIPKNHMTGLTNKVPYDGTPFYMRIDCRKDPFYTQLTGPNDAGGGIIPISPSRLNMISSVASENGLCCMDLSS